MRKRMATISIPVPEDVLDEMNSFSINWPAFARKAFIEKLERMKRMEKLASKSKLTQKDVDEFSDMLKRNVAKRLFR